MDCWSRVLFNRVGSVKRITERKISLTSWIFSVNGALVHQLTDLHVVFQYILKARNNHNRQVGSARVFQTFVLN